MRMKMDHQRDVEIAMRAMDLASPALADSIRRLLLSGVEPGDVVGIIADRLEPALASTFSTDEQWRAWGDEVVGLDGMRLVVGAHARDKIRRDFASRGDDLLAIANEQLSRPASTNKTWVVLIVAGSLNCIEFETDVSPALRAQRNA
jgi:hypothetical protein